MLKQTIHKRFTIPVFNRPVQNEWLSLSDSYTHAQADNNAVPANMTVDIIHKRPGDFHAGT